MGNLTLTFVADHGVPSGSWIENPRSSVPRNSENGVPPGMSPHRR